MLTSHQQNFLKAVESGNINLIKELYNESILTKNFKVEIIHTAAGKGHNPILQFFIDKGLDINAKTNSGATAIHYAAINGQIETIEFLVSKELDINARDNSGTTAIHLAAMKRHIETIEFLVSKELDINAKTNSGATAIHYAAVNGQIETIEYLVGKGLDINARNNIGTTALHLAAMNGQIETIEYLVGKGLDINARNNLGETALDIAKKKGLKNMEDLIIQLQLMPEIEVMRKQITDLNVALKEKDKIILQLEAKINQQEERIENLVSKLDILQQQTITTTTTTSTDQYDISDIGFLAQLATIKPEPGEEVNLETITPVVTEKRQRPEEYQHKKTQETQSNKRRKFSEEFSPSSTTAVERLVARGARDSSHTPSM